jgi:hypothetical protein
MHFFEQGAQALRAEGQMLWSSLRDRRLLASLALFLALLLLAAQAPLHYALEIGTEEGYLSDRPIVANFYDPETSPSTGSNFRWTSERSLIRLPGVGQRSIELRLRLLPVNQEVAARGPKQIEVWSDGSLLGRLPIRPTSGGTYRLLVPASRSGDQEIELRGTTFTPTGDPRSIGTPVDAALIESQAGPVWPAWSSTLIWLAAALLLWLGLRRAGLAPTMALAGLLAGVLLASLAALLDPPRFAFGATPALIALALGWLLMLLLNAAPAGLLLAGAALALPAAVLLAALGTETYENWGGPGAVALGLAAALLLAGWLRPAIGSLYCHIAPPIPPAARRWLTLLALLGLAARYGGTIYADARWGDIGFHTNRYTEVLQGLVLLLSRNRGVDFPYPPAFYLLLAPFALLGIDKRVLLQLGGALLDAASPFLVYSIAMSIDERRKTKDERSGGHSTSWHRGVLAAGIYSLSASGFMITWWNFSTHTFSQFAHLLLITAIVTLWPRLTKDQGLRTKGSSSSLVFGLWSFVTLFMLQSLVYLGHFGFWINMTLLGGMGLAALLVAVARTRGSWGGFWGLLAAFVAAELFAALVYSSAYTGLFIAQVQATATGGLTGLANRGPTDRALLWRNLWDAGFRIHFGFFAVPLSLCGLALLLRRKTKDEGRKAESSTQTQRAFVFRRLSLVVLMLGTFVIALLFGSLPFISGSTLSTRWLMFSAWAIAVGAALTAQLLWRSGRAGRWLVIATGGYMLWITASQWLGALAWRIRPPEPF